MTEIPGSFPICKLTPEISEARGSLPDLLGFAAFVGFFDLTALETQKSAT